jgi:prepilin peptidase CpaA
MGEWVVTLLLVALALLLVSAGIQDARTREIANWKNAAIALMAAFFQLALQLGVAALVFALFVGAFALGQMGGGDVKMIGALALWLPVMPLVWMLVLMSLIGGVLTIVMVIERKWRRNGGGPVEIPYGVAIAIAALLVLREPIFNQFG